LARINSAVTVHVLELDLTAVPEAVHDRAALLGAVTRALLAAMNQIPNTHLPDGAGTPRIAVRYQPDAAGAFLSVTEPGPGQLLAATVGHVQTRPVARPTPTGWPDITFRPTALLAVASRPGALTGAELADVLGIVAAGIRGR
jgi:hypothetical protein